MSLVVGSKTQSSPAPSGSHPARCFRVIDMGTQTSTGQWGTKSQRKLLIQWELPTETHVFKEENGPEPYSLSKTFTQSLHEKAGLRKFLEGWRGRSFTEEELKRFDVGTILGKPALLGVIHESKDGKTYANIASISVLPKGLACPPEVNKPCTLSLEQEEFDAKVFASLPAWMQGQIANSPEYKALGLDGSNHSDDEGIGYDPDSEECPF